MFITRPEFAECLPPLEGYEGAEGWGILEMAGAFPCFLLIVEPVDSWTDLVETTYFVGGMTKLLELLSGTSSTVCLDPRAPLRIVALYPPGWSGTKRDWNTHEIQEIWEGHIHQRGVRYSTWVVRTVSDEEFVEPAVLEQRLPVARTRRIFRRQTPDADAA